MGLLVSKLSSPRINMSTVSVQTVKDIIATDKIVIFSKTYCPYCTMAKEVFDKLKQTYTAIELDQRNDTEEIQNVLGEITGARTVPRVFINGSFVGGGTDVKKLYENGELENMLTAA